MKKAVKKSRAKSSPSLTDIGSVGRTSAGLRDALFEELDLLRAGKTTAQKANATAKLAGAITSTVQMEMDVYALLARTKGKMMARELPALTLA